MQLAKASKEDIEKLSDFFNQWELLESEGWHISEEVYDEETLERLADFLPDKFKDSWGDVNADQVRIAFFKKWLSELDWRWRRVVIGCDVLIDNCCDPDKDHLALHPKFQTGSQAA